MDMLQNLTHMVIKIAAGNIALNFKRCGSLSLKLRPDLLCRVNVTYDYNTV